MLRLLGLKVRCEKLVRFRYMGKWRGGGMQGGCLNWVIGTFHPICDQQLTDPCRPPSGHFQQHRTLPPGCPQVTNIDSRNTPGALTALACLVRHQLKKRIGGMGSYAIGRITQGTAPFAIMKVGTQWRCLSILEFDCSKPINVNCSDTHTHSHDELVNA
jgi:hypothetical protein